MFTEERDAALRISRFAQLGSGKRMARNMRTRGEVLGTSSCSSPVADNGLQLSLSRCCLFWLLLKLLTESTESAWTGRPYRVMHTLRISLGMYWCVYTPSSIQSCPHLALAIHSLWVGSVYAGGGWRDNKRQHCTDSRRPVALRRC